MTSQVSSQERPLEPAFSATASAGVSYAYNRWPFAFSPETVYPVKFKPGFTLGITYGPIAGIAGAQVYSSIDVSYLQLTTDHEDISKFYGNPIPNGTYTAYMETKRIPIMARVEVSTMSRLSPCIRAGIGYSRTEFTEEYSFPSDYNVAIDNWAFTWSIGAALNYKLSESYIVGLFLDDWIVGSDLLSTASDGTMIGLAGPSKITLVGVRLDVGL